MKRLLFCLVPWMVLAASVEARQVKTADVLYTFHDAVPQRGYRLGDECFVPVDGLTNFGWDAVVRGDAADIKAEGQRFTMPTRVFNGQLTIPLRKAIDRLGATSSWQSPRDVLEVYSVVSMIRARDGKVHLEAQVSVKPTATIQTNPNRVVLDLAGARLMSGTEQDLDDGVKVTQLKPNTVRIVIETPGAPSIPRGASDAKKKLDIDFNPPGGFPKRPRIDTQPKTVNPADQNQTTVDPGAYQPDEPQNDPNQANPDQGNSNISPTYDPNNEGDASQSALPLSLDIEGPSATLLRIAITSVPIGQIQFRKPDASTLEVSLPGVQMSLPEDFHLNTESILSSVTRSYDGGTVLVLQLARPMGAEVWVDGDGIKIQLLRPNVGNGKLAGKVVVVDPGHGGHDRGAHAGDVNEKDLNLKMGRLIASELAAQGATVVMTRKSDVFITLDNRSDMANRNGADFFISSHINSTGGSGNRSGTITFFHAKNATSRLLAECIHQEICKVNNLPSIGVWSDQRIYRSGFSVLRQTKMPGVLLELGFINNARDRARLVQPDFQTAVAAAVVRGLRIYLGDVKN